MWPHTHHPTTVFSSSYKASSTKGILDRSFMRIGQKKTKKKTTTTKKNAGPSFFSFSLKKLDTLRDQEQDKLKCGYGFSSRLCIIWSQKWIRHMSNGNPNGDSQRAKVRPANGPRLFGCRVKKWENVPPGFLDVDHRATVTCVYDQ